MTVDVLPFGPVIVSVVDDRLTATVVLADLAVATQVDVLATVAVHTPGDAPLRVQLPW